MISDIGVILSINDGYKYNFINLFFNFYILIDLYILIVIMYSLIKLLILILFFIGILFISVDLIKENKICPPEKIVYKYIPRTFEEEQNSPVYVSDIFRTMFANPSPWVRSSQDVDTRKTEALNKYFISQA